ncbi:MAG: 8-oxo-dGTP pyrophosphatase MutT (NUDIX family) [Glaciecola sp.]|jgi:8-oxo-dGTP pyrophosphatase MutT (NUDIX family)
MSCRRYAAKPRLTWRKLASYPTQRATSAGGVVFDDRGGGGRWVLLIARRNALGKAQWTLPKGGLEAGEGAPEAALREVREETGHTCTIDMPLGTIDFWFIWREDAIRYHKYVHYYLMRWDGQEPGPRDDEAEHVEWVPLESAMVRLAHRNERDLVATGAARPLRDGTPSPWASMAPSTPVTFDAADAANCAVPAHREASQAPQDPPHVEGHP